MGLKGGDYAAAVGWRDIVDMLGVLATVVAAWAAVVAILTSVETGARPTS